MARMPGADWRPISVNHTKGGQRQVRGVVVHIMAGTLAGTDAWFHQSRAQASSHFGTGRDGDIYQWVDSADKAWAQAGGNPYWLSVENAGRGGDELTDEQLDANARILAWAHERYGVPLQVTSDPNGRGLGHHGMGGRAWGNHTACPGPRIIAQKAEIVKRAKALVAGGKPKPDPKPASKPIKVVWDGDVPRWPGRVLAYTPDEAMLHGEDVEAWQIKMAKRGWTVDVDGWYGKQSVGVCRGYQEATGLLKTGTGRVDEATWDMTWSWRPSAPAKS